MARAGPAVQTSGGRTVCSLCGDRAARAACGSVVRPHRAAPARDQWDTSGVRRLGSGWLEHPRQWLGAQRAGRSPEKRRREQSGAPRAEAPEPKPGTAKGGALTMLLRPHVDIRVVRAGDQPARSVVGCIQPTTSARAVRVCARGRRVRRAGAAEPSHALTEAEVRTNYGHNPR